jgi:hypothetical protein
MREKFKDQRLLDGIMAEFPVGCRKISPGDPFMEAIQKDNVDVHFTHGVYFRLFPLQIVSGPPNLRLAQNNRSQRSIILAWSQEVILTP